MPLIETVRGNLFVDDQRHDKQAMPSILIHGAGRTHQGFPSYLRQLPALNAITPDLAGHGNSSPAGRTTIFDYALDLIALLDAVQIPTVNLVGHSMGGAIALQLALDFPRRINRLILLGTGAQLRVNQQIITGIVEDTDATIAMMDKWMYARSTPAQLQADMAQQLKQTDVGVIQGDYIACDGFDVRERLAEIQVPTLIVVGEHDKMTPLKLSQYLHEHIRNSELVILPNAGHMLMWEQPQSTQSTLEAWLTG